MFIFILHLHLRRNTWMLAYSGNVCAILPSRHGASHTHVLLVLQISVRVPLGDLVHVANAEEVHVGTGLEVALHGTAQPLERLAIQANCVFCLEG